MADQNIHSIYNLSANLTYAPDEFCPKDGDTDNPFKLCTDWDPEREPTYEDITATPGDYVKATNNVNDDPAVPKIMDWQALYVYTVNGDWKFAGGTDLNGFFSGYYMGSYINDCAQFDVMLPNGEQVNIEGATDDEVFILEFPRWCIVPSLRETGTKCGWG